MCKCICVCVFHAKMLFILFVHSFGVKMSKFINIEQLMPWMLDKQCEMHLLIMCN